MNDAKLLAACAADRSAWEKIQKHVNAKDLTPVAGFWWEILADSYNRDKSAKRMDLDTLASLGYPKIPSPKQEASIMGILEHMAAPASAINVVQIALELKRKNLTAEFASASMGGETKKANKLLKELNEVWESEGFEEQAEWNDSRPTIELFDRVGANQRIPFGPPPINARLGGGLLPGQHVVIFGRTEVGKSSFVIDAATRLLKSKQRVLYIGNEDQIDILKLRMLGRCLKKTQEQLEADPQGAAEEFKQFEDNLLMTQLYNGSIDSIRQRVIEWEPTVLVIDQFRNLSGTEDGMTQRMEANAIKLRALLLERSLIGVSVTQANDRSERHGQEAPIYLQTGDVDSSRVGLPSQADLLLGIGANEQLKQRGQRFISFCKNKCSAKADAHEGVIVNFDLSISRVS